MLNVANGDRHTPNCVNLPVQANDAVHEVPPYVSGVLLSAEKTHSNTSVSQVAPLVGFLALIADSPLYRRKLRDHMRVDNGE